MTRLSTQEALQKQLELATTTGLPGVSAAIGSGGSIIWRGQAGLSSITKNQVVKPDDIFPIGSITKVFISIIILQLHEQKLISLDSTLGEHLDAKVLEYIPNAAGATIASCMNHTSGIPSWEDDPNWIRVGRGEDINPEHLWCEDETLQYIRHPSPLVPGEFSYSNTNFTLLGLVIEKLTGRSAVEEMRNRILVPLGMNSTFLEGFELGMPLEMVAARYHYGNEEFRQTAGISKCFPEVRTGVIDVSVSNLSTEWVAGGNISTPEDLVHFFTAIRDARLVSQKSLEIMESWTPVVKGGKDVDVGHGLFRKDLGGDLGKIVFHNGSVLGGSAAVWWSEERDCIISVVSNIGTMHCGQVLGGFSVATGSPPFEDFPGLALALVEGK